MIETMTGKTLTVSGVSDVAELKERIRRLDGTPVHLQRFYCGEERLADDDFLSFYSEETIHLRWKRSKLG
jgi:hypothetical protein